MRNGLCYLVCYLYLHRTKCINGVFLFGNGCIVKTRKEANKMALSDSISATKAKIEEHKKIVVDQRARKDEYEEIISYQSEGILFLFRRVLDKCSKLPFIENSI